MNPDSLYAAEKNSIISIGVCSTFSVNSSSRVCCSFCAMVSIIFSWNGVAFCHGFKLSSDKSWVVYSSSFVTVMSAFVSFSLSIRVDLPQPGIPMNLIVVIIFATGR